MFQWYTAGDKMAAFKWIVLLLACNLIGLFDDRSVTAAPVYDSKESQNSEAIDSTSEDMKDDVISSTHEEDTHSEGTSGDETAEKGDENVSNMEGDEAGSGRELGDTDEYSEISSNTHANDDAGKAQNVSDEEEGGNEEKSSIENEDKSLDGTLPEEGDETNEENSSKENEDKSMDGTLPEEGDETNEKNTPTETQHNDDLSLPVNDDKTGLDGNVESDREADSSNSELNQGSSASSEQGNDDEYQMSSVPTEAPDSEMLGGNYDDSNLPFSESKVAPLKEEQGDDDDGDDDDNNDDNDSDGGTVAEDHGDNVSDSDGPAGDQSETDAEHAAELHENTEKDNTEVNKDDNDDDESEIDSGTEAPDDTHGALVSSSEDGTEDQNNNMEGNNSGVAESSPQGMKEEEDDDDDDDVDISEEGDSGTDTRDDISDTSSEVGTDDQNPSVEGSSQVGGSIIEPHAEISAKHFLQAARAFKPLPVPSSDSITSNNETEKKDDPATTDISQKADNESNIAANITGNLGEDEDRQSETSVENAVTTSVPGFENNTLHGSRVQKVALDDDGINEPGLGSQKRDSVSSSSIGSYVVLGVIMAVIVVLLGYSVLKGRSKHAQGAKNEDFGTEMSDVKKNLLPRNEIKGEIQPNTRPEGDESNAKLLPDAQCTGNNVQNGEAGVADQNDVDSQKELGEIDDAPTEKKINFVRPEIQSEPTDSPEDTLNSQNQNRNNPFKGAVTPKKEETADGQSTHHRSLNTSSHQNTYNNVNGVPEAVFKKEPGQMHSRSVTQNSNVPVIIHRGFQQQPMHTVYSSAPQPTVIQTYPVEKVTVETKIITY